MIERHEEETFNLELEREEGEECLATWIVQATPGTTYWRCHVPARHLPGQSIIFRYTDLVEVEDGVIASPRFKGDTLIWQFLGDLVRSRVAWTYQSQGERILMEVDDNYLRPVPKNQRHTSVWYPTIDESLEMLQKGKGNGYSNEAHQRDAQWVDGIIASTWYLADVYSEYNDSVYLCPNSIDPVDWQYEREEHEPFRIVYYGGSSHMNIDTPLVTKALKWASRQPGVEVYLVGARNPSWSFDYTYIPWERDLREARKHLFKFDLGLAPLKGNPWSNGKSDIKAMEYAMAGVMPLMSDVIPYADWKSPLPDLVLRDNEWDEAIRHFVNNRELVPKLAAEAKEWVLSNRTIETTIDSWREAVNGS